MTLLSCSNCGLIGCNHAQVRRGKMEAVEFPKEWLGVDVGWVHPAADSDGNVYAWTRRRSPKDWIATEAGPVTIRKRSGERIVQPAYSLRGAAIALAREDRMACRQVASRVVSTAKRNGLGVALEDWSGFQRRKGAWVVMYQEIEMNAGARDIPIVQVNRAYTSITCPKCGHKGRENRPTRGWFTCVECGREGHADVIAAINIAAKAEGIFGVNPGLCETPECGATAWSAGRCSPCYHFGRRHGRHPSVEEIAARKDPTHFRATRKREALWEREERLNAATDERFRRSWATHDAWGNPLVEVLQSESH